MSYDNPNRETYLFPVHDFGAGAGAVNLKGPKGKSGVLIDYGVQNTSEIFNAVTTPATISVGTAADVDAFGEEFSLGVTAASSGASLRTALNDDSEIYVAEYIVNRFIPKDTIVRLTFAPPTGGTPTGIGQPFVVIDWAW